MDYVENKEDCMKATGIVRRIDDLGRIVIPKEIRRTLRIRETDPMEIYTDMDGQIVLKKYSPMADVSEFAVEYAESIAQNTGMTIAITDRDCVIAAAGTQKKNVQGKHITKELNDIMDKRQSVVASASENDYVKAVTDYDCESEVISPIICAGDVLGMVIMFGNDKKQKLGESEKRIVKVAADFLGKEVKTDLKYLDPEIPPIAEIDGVDLTTEGVITMSRVLEYAKSYLNDDDIYADWSVRADGASQIARILFQEATDINFFVGTAINPAHQNPNLPINFNIKMQLVTELSEYLKKMGKRIKVSYF